MGFPDVVAWVLLIGGIAMIIFELLNKEEDNKIDSLQKISYGQAFGIGLAQGLALIPGVSRAAASIFGGLALGLKRKTIVEFSFLLAVPTVIAAAGLDLVKSWNGFGSHELVLLAWGSGISFLIAIATIKWLLKYIQNHNFIWFGVYRIILALIFLLWL